MRCTLATDPHRFPLCRPVGGVATEVLAGILKCLERRLVIHQASGEGHSAAIDMNIAACLY
jgi:hypothetical protein